MITPTWIAAIALGLGLWLALWVRLAHVPLRRVQWRGPAAVVLGVNATCLFYLLGSSISSATSYVFGLAALAAIAAMPPILAWPMVARRRR